LHVAVPFHDGRSVVDDDSDEDLCVFSGSDLLISYYDVADLDWQDVAERSAIDERRGLVIAQVAALADPIEALRRVVRRRNTLAHGTIFCRPVRPPSMRHT